MSAETKRLKLTLEMDNDAFSDGNQNPEVARILRNAAEKIENGADGGFLFDLNGNKVGQFDIY